MFDDLVETLKEMVTASAVSTIQAVQASDLQDRGRAYLRDLVKNSIRPVLQSRLDAHLEALKKGGEDAESKTAREALVEILGRLERYPEVWVLEANPEALTLKFRIPESEREMNLLAARIENGSSTIPKVPHMARVRRFFMEEVSRIAEKSGAKR